ncbi:MAG TPA: triose-phosphate isomerase [Streptosporangiaceae bacterium]
MAGNWKMNNNHLEAIALVQKLAFVFKDADYEAVDIAVLPPFTDIRSVQTLIDADRLRIAYGAQDLSAHEKGAYTGEISGVMLAKLGCSYVVVGHSERREYHAEDEPLVNAKVKAAFAVRLTPIVCIGEGLEIRQADEHVAHTLAQLDGALEKIPADQARTLVIAYEPVWAIGTGRTATPEMAREAHETIKALHDTRVLYGGSVKPENAAELMAQPAIDGALVGGASLEPESFAVVCRAALR